MQFCFLLSTFHLFAFLLPIFFQTCISFFFLSKCDHIFQASFLEMFLMCKVEIE